jgi:hypothetical protein
MLRILNALVPRFMTQYYTLIPIPGAKATLPILTCCEEHIDPRYPGMRIKFFYLFGLKLGKRVSFQAPKFKVPHA